MYIQTSDQDSMRLGIAGCTCNWGTHICGLYESDEEREDTIFSFLGEGLADGDQMFHVTQRSSEGFREAFASRFREWETSIQDPSRLATADPLELYCPDGRFDPVRMEESLARKFSDSQSAGAKPLRSIGDMGWATARIEGIEHLMTYEARLNLLVPGKPWVTICLYDVRKFSGSMILSVLQTHPVVISGGVIVKNPFYVRPESWLAQHAVHPN